jgi:hypothetical protein
MTTAGRRSDVALNIVDIFVLACFAIAQPLFQLLSRSDALFISHGSRAGDVLLLVLGACVAPAGALAVVELLSAKLLPCTVAAVHRVILSLLLALILLPIMKRALPVAGGVCVSIAVVLAAVISIQYLRIRTWRWSVVYLSPALLLFPGLLLFGSPVSAILFPRRAPKLVHARVGNPVPVVMVVFDEFPLSSLMDRSGNIDAVLYPSFAELSRQATWYRNATTVAEGTLISVPAILDGKYPVPGQPKLPNAAGHPNTLFTLLGGTYGMNVVENNTRLCPEPLCGSATAPVYRRMAPLVRDSAVLWLYAVLPSDLTGPLPDISQAWANFTNAPGEPATPEMWARFDELADWHDRAQEFRKFTNSIQPSPWPVLHFLHVLLPHAPWKYLPSGQRYPDGDGRIRGLRGANDRGEDPQRWSQDPWAAAQSYQRHLLQVGFVDLLVGELLAHLRGTALYDSSLIVITADHGTSFRPGDSRRLVTPANHADLMAVPLFIKYPNQHVGGIDDRNALTIDILPAIAETLRVRPSWKMDGESLLADARKSPAKVIFSDSGKRFEFTGGLADVYASLNYKLGIFGDEGNLYRAGDRYGWTGREAPSASVEPGLRYELHRAGYFSKVDPGAPALVTNIGGRVIRDRFFDDRSIPLPLAVAVNGIVHAVTETYRDGGEDAFTAMVPHTALRTGRNDVGIFLIREGGDELARLTSAATPLYEWGTRLDFGENGNAGPYFGVGWSTPSDNLTWADGRFATLYLPTRVPQSDVTLKGSFAAFTHRWKPWRQRVRVLVNKHEVANWALKISFREFRALVPRHYFAGAADTTEIAFEMPDATAPISIGANRDSRTLGAAIMWMQLTTARPPEAAVQE